MSESITPDNSSIEDALARDTINSSDAHGPVQNLPPGLRGGANDPAYQPGWRYDFKRGGLISDDGSHHKGAKDGGSKASLGGRIIGSFKGKFLHNSDSTQEGQATKTGHKNDAS